ncbi:MAG: serine/threonine-protein kinase [Anaerolineales bacterium]
MFSDLDQRRLTLDTYRISPEDDNEEYLDTIQHLKPGTILQDRYLIEGGLGVGGMGAVYRARDMRFIVKKFVAVKEMINRARDENLQETIVKNFEREANILASFNHPAIPTIYDYFTLGNRSYLVMEFVEGRNLEDIMNEQEGFFPIDNVVRWAIQLCDVIHYLHTHHPEPIVFRDMKPANVMITPEDEIVLVDFGIAKPFQTGQKGTMIGTEGYSPPEQYRGEATPVVDIYALGATIHHLLTRKDPRIEPPFTFSERPIKKFNPSVPSELEQIINTALQYNPSDRFQNADEMKKALIKFGRKINLSTGIVGKKRRISQDTNLKPIWKFECEDEVRGTATIHSGVLYIGAYDNNLYALKANTGDFLWKYPTEGGVVSKPAVFENNIYFGSEDYKIHVVSARTRNTKWTYKTQAPIRSSPCISERHVFIGSDDNHLHVINAVSGRLAWRMDAGASVRSTPLVNGDSVYFGTESGDFYCVDFRGNIKWRSKAKRAITSSPKIANNIIYFGSMDATLYALDAKTGWVIWRFRMDKGSISTPLVADDLVITGSADGNIYCINVRSSNKIWHFETNHQVTGSPSVYKDAIYCGSVDGNLYCLDTKTGRLRWKIQTGGPITSTPVVHDDIVYIGSTDHFVYAFPA